MAAGFSNPHTDDLAADATTAPEGVIEALILRWRGLTKAHATSNKGFREHTPWHFTIIPGWVGGMITKRHDLVEHELDNGVSTGSSRGSRQP
jgi:hypothetical protein